jgi:hypothetical protein
MNNKQTLVTLSLLMFTVILFFWIPLVIIWSLNNLFMLDIPFTWKTWLSVYILWALIASSINRENSSNNFTKDFWR